MPACIRVIGAGLAGSEAALVLARLGCKVQLVEMRPAVATPVHTSDKCAELVCSNSMKTMKLHTAAGMQKCELHLLQSPLYTIALRHRVGAGDTLAIDRSAFSSEVTRRIDACDCIELQRREAQSIASELSDCDALIIATGPLTSDSFSNSFARLTGMQHLYFFDAASPIVAAESLEISHLFFQNRYDQESGSAGDYLNAALTEDEYDRFVSALIQADRVILRDFETKELFQACQPIEEIARSGYDALRFGPLKPVGLTDPSSGMRPWAVVQLRPENCYRQSYNLVGFQTNLTIPEQMRVFRMIPGLENAEFVRFGVMHRNTFINAPHLLDNTLRLHTPCSAKYKIPIFVAGQLSGTEGYLEAVRSGHHAALCAAAYVKDMIVPHLPETTAFGALLAYATSSDTLRYQPSHVNFGLMPPLESFIRSKKRRYAEYATRGKLAMETYIQELIRLGLFSGIDNE